MSAETGGGYAPLLWALKEAPLVMNDAGRLDQAAMLVLIQLARYANGKSLKAWQKVSTIAKDSGLGDETVRRALQRLAKKRVIELDGYTEGGVARWRLRTDLKRSDQHVSAVEEARQKRREQAAQRQRSRRARQRHALEQRDNTKGHSLDTPSETEQEGNCHVAEHRDVTPPNCVTHASEARDVTHSAAEGTTSFELPLNSQERTTNHSVGASASGRRANSATEASSDEHPKNPEADPVQAPGPGARPSSAEAKGGLEEEQAATTVPSPALGDLGRDWRDGLADEEPQTASSESMPVPFIDMARARGLARKAKPYLSVIQRRSWPNDKLATLMVDARAGQPKAVEKLRALCLPGHIVDAVLPALAS